MNVLILFCHPEANSFNAAMKNTAAETFRSIGHKVEISDLYSERFDPAEKAEHYLQRDNSNCFSVLGEQRHASKNSCLPGDVQKEINRLERADLVIFQFPIWWHSQPAMLKGWFERVMVNGGLYNSSMRYNNGYFRGKRAICSVTIGAPQSAFGPERRGGTIDQILWSFHYSLFYMGFAVLPAFVAYGIQGHGYSYQGEKEFKAQLQNYKTNWSKQLTQIDQIQPLHFCVDV